MTVVPLVLLSPPPQDCGTGNDNTGPAYKESYFLYDYDDDKKTNQSERTRSGASDPTGSCWTGLLR